MTQILTIHTQQGIGAADNSSESQKQTNETRVPDDIEAETRAYLCRFCCDLSQHGENRGPTIRHGSAAGRRATIAIALIQERHITIKNRHRELLHAGITRFQKVIGHRQIGTDRERIPGRKAALGRDRRGVASS
jgi:hypothetical protein